MIFPFPTNPKEAGKFPLVSFTSLKSGAGATTLACMSALINAPLKSTAIVDFSPEGKVRSYMGFPPEISSASILDLMQEEDSQAILRAGEEHSSGVRVIPAPSKPMDFLSVNPSLLLKISSFMKRGFDLNITVLGQLQQSWIATMLSDMIVVVVEGNRANIDAFKDHKEFLKRLGCLDRTKIILNQAGRPGDIEKKDAIEFFKPDIVIDYDKNISLTTNKRDIQISNKVQIELKKLFKNIPEPLEEYVFDKYLIGSLAVNAGLMETSIQASNAYDDKEDIIPRDMYKDLKDNRVRPIVLRQLTIEETDPLQARTPIVKSKFNNMVYNAIKDAEINVSEQDIPILIERLFSDILGLGPLEKYFEDLLVSEIIVNGLDIFVEKNGVDRLVEEKFESIEQGVDLIRRMIIRTSERFDVANPQASARLHDGSRLMAQMSPIAVDGLLISIRRYRADITIDKLLEYRATSPELMDFMKIAIEEAFNVVVCGSTSSGKTTWLNVFAGFIPKDEKIITVEDPAELQLHLHHTKVRRLEARKANMEGKGSYTLRDGTQASLRMSPNRIVAGEVRGGEAFDMLQAMSTGHDGSLTTGHANSAHECINRIANMVNMAKDLNLPHRVIMDLIAGSIDFIVHVTKERRTGRRRIDHIVEVVGPIKAENGESVGVELNTLWQYDTNADDWLFVADKFHRETDFKEAGWERP